MVAERVNSAPDTIRRHYDKASEREKMLNRRREFVDELDIDDESDGGESNE